LQGYDETIDGTDHGVNVLVGRSASSDAELSDKGRVLGRYLSAGGGYAGSQSYCQVDSLEKSETITQRKSLDSLDGTFAESISQHEVKGAKHVVARILSSTALLVLEVYETSAQLCLFAYHSNPNEIEEEPFAFPVARYALPTLPRGFTYITAHFDCSPVSLSGRRKDRGTNHLLEDGAGIFTITLEMQSWVSSETDGESDYPVDDWHVSWDFMTAVGLIDGFHRAAKRALGSLNREAATAVIDFESWSSRSLSWLPKHTFPPSRNSMCGYRLAMTEDSRNDGSASVGGGADHGKCVSVYDFTPAYVKEASMTAFEGTSNGGDSATIDVSQSWAMASQDSPNNTAIKSVIKWSAPSVAPHVLSEALAKYDTNAPYLVSTRNVRIAGPDLQSVVHLTSDYMLFAQVRGVS
jgi:hypothetical protein